MFKPQYTSQGADKMKLNQFFSRAVYAINKAQYVATKLPSNKTSPQLK